MVVDLTTMLLEPLSVFEEVVAAMIRSEHQRLTSTLALVSELAVVLWCL